MMFGLSLKLLYLRTPVGHEWDKVYLGKKAIQKDPPRDMERKKKKTLFKNLASSSPHACIGAWRTKMTIR
jgi:hypothetical protein